MNPVRDAYSMQQWWSGRFIIAVIMMGLAFPVMPVTAQAFEVDRPVSCRATETAELNRWPLRTSDMAGCEKQNRGQSGTALTRSRSELQGLPLNRWPYEFRAQEIESANTLIVEDTQAHRTTSIRTEPDLNMWPLWPKS